jgi:hypothetical protein
MYFGRVSDMTLDVTGDLSLKSPNPVITVDYINP